MRKLFNCWFLGACVLVVCVCFTGCNRGAENVGFKDAEWASHGHDGYEQRYSELKGINVGTANELGLAWSFDGFTTRGQVRRGMEATPIMVGGVLYFTGTWSVVYAVDARTGELIWEYDPEVDGQWIRKTCCDAVNRGVAVRDGKVFVGTLDGYLDALDIKTGVRIWRQDTLIDRRRAYSITGAPRIAGDNIVIGNGGAELGVRGYVSAYNLQTGEMVWRFFTVPGDPKGEDEHIEITQARTTWSKDSRWDVGGGGTVWDSMVYDSKLDVLYIGVGNGSPWPSWLRSPGGGDNLYLSSIVALEAKTGKMVWHYQTTPADSWDYTATQHMILARLTINGEDRDIIMQAPKNGFFYVLDRVTGELLSAEKYTRVTWADRIDLETGRPVLTGIGNYQKEGKTIWPSTAGGHNWQPMAYNKDLGLVYIPMLELPMTFTSHQSVSFQQDSILVGANARPPRPGSPQAQGVFQNVLTAWDPVAQKAVWKSKPKSWWGGGVLATAGGIVIQGNAEGYLDVLNAKDGTVLKSIPTGVGIIAAPITYALDGEQYISVLTGFGGGIKRYLPGVAALKYENKPQLLTFKLGGVAVVLPEELEADTLNPVYTESNVSPEFVAEGRRVFMGNCGRCHAFRGAKNGYPNLWNMSENTYESFDAIVSEGALEYGGMPNFKDVLDEKQVLALKVFLAADQKASR
ncbi:MAG: PQQ-dependent dehydrogenase, methanol/ethanol family [Robiginitomaculum sp.]|nr:MAG: PQQ-dependent dehydrogenase, methanol/ethanol family [Robiginitomaculum sp.]